MKSGKMKGFRRRPFIRCTVLRAMDHILNGSLIDRRPSHSYSHGATLWHRDQLSNTNNSADLIINEFPELLSQNSNIHMVRRHLEKKRYFKLPRQKSVSCL